MTIQEYDQLYTSTIEKITGDFLLQLNLRHVRHFSSSADPAIVLAMVVDTVLAKSNNRQDAEALQHRDMWILFPANQIQKQTGMSAYRQRQAIKCLTEDGVLEMEHRDKNRMWVRINTDRLVEIGS